MSEGTEKRDENELIAERRRKLNTLRESGNAYPNDFRRNALAEELHQSYGKHEDEHLREEAVQVSVAGRMMVKRVMGKASFIKLQDRTGQIQVRLERDFACRCDESQVCESVAGSGPLGRWIS